MSTINTLKIFMLSAAGAAMLASCSLFQQNGGTSQEGRVVTLADGRKVVVASQPGAGQEPAGPKVIKKKSEKSYAKPKNSDKKKNKKKKDKNNAQVAVSDREKVALDGSAAAATAAKAETVKQDKAQADVAAVQADFTPAGEWTIYSVRNEKVTGEERPYITLDLASGRFYGNNGCNYINGDLQFGDNRALKFDNMISTMKMCQDDSFQYVINLALNDVVAYDVCQEKPITFLDLKDKSGRVVMVLRRHNMDFLNGAWKVTELHGTPLVQDDDATMTFDTDGLKIHGTTGCNIFNGSLFIDPDKKESLQIIGLATTRMMCAPDSRETEFLLALESVETARKVGADEIVLSDVDGKPLFTLHKMEQRD